MLRQPSEKGAARPVTSCQFSVMFTELANTHALRGLMLLFLVLAGEAGAVDLVIIGDSVSALSDDGAWSAGQGYGALVASRSGMTEVNLAVSGARVSDMHAQWKEAIARNPKPAGIIAQLGENDIYWQTDLAAFKSQIESDVSAALAAGIPVTLNTTFHRQIPSSWYLRAMPYVQTVREVAAAHNLVVVDVFAWFAQLSLTDPNYASYFYTGDGINAHPTVAGQAQIASLFQMPQHANAVGYSPPPPAQTIPDPPGHGPSASCEDLGSAVHLSELGRRPALDPTTLASCRSNAR